MNNTFRIGALLMSGYVVGVGAANVDVHGKSKKPLIMRDSNPGRMNTSAGGVTRNILENLARLGVDSRLVCAIGTDVFGDKIRRDSETAGINLNDALIVDGAASSTYLSLLDDSGDMFVALSDMSIAKNITAAFLDSKRPLLRGASAIVCDACLPAESMRHLVFAASEGVPVFVDPVSTSYAAVIKDFVGGFHTVKPNVLELEILSGIKISDGESLDLACSILIEKGVTQVIASLGKDGCFYKNSNGSTLSKKLRPVEVMTNATGAGDAFLGAAVYAFMHGFAENAMLEFSLAAGIAALEAETTISPIMSVDLLNKIIRERQL